MQSAKKESAETQCTSSKQSRKRETNGKNQKKMCMEPLPYSELCRYEQIREDIIREREDAMAKFNFYESLDKTKEDIGLYSRRTEKSENNVEEGKEQNSDSGVHQKDVGEKTLLREEGEDKMKEGGR